MLQRLLNWMEEQSEDFEILIYKVHIFLLTIKSLIKIMFVVIISISWRRHNKTEEMWSVSQMTE